MNLTAKITIPSTVFTQVIDDEMVILEMDSTEYFALDSVARIMWEQLSIDASLEALYQYMLLHYEVEASVLEEDIKVFVLALVKHGLMKVEE